MKNFFNLLIIIVSFLQAVNAQTITGIITDANTKEALIGVNIILDNGMGTASDIEGKYQLKTKEGELKITFKYIGYEDIMKIISLEKNETKKINKNNNGLIISNCIRFKFIQKILFQIK